jgi:hypothetical protein
VNNDDENKVAEIRQKRWYHTNTTMGADGWPAVNEFAHNWKIYVLFDPHDAGEPLATIKAENDKVAVEAFSATYNMRRCHICEKIVTYREVPA